MPALATVRRSVLHGKTCHKVRHSGGGYLHDASDDGPYDVDGVQYCGRCHSAVADCAVEEDIVIELPLLAGGQQIHVFDENGSFVVWLDTEVAERDGLTIGMGDTAQEALTDAIEVLGEAERQLLQYRDQVKNGD